jgi:hypothetical protein
LGVVDPFSLLDWQRDYLTSHLGTDLRDLLQAKTSKPFLL